MVLDDELDVVVDVRPRALDVPDGDPLAVARLRRPLSFDHRRRRQIVEDPVVVVLFLDQIQHLLRLLRPTYVRAAQGSGRVTMCTTESGVSTARPTQGGSLNRTPDVERPVFTSQRTLQYVSSSVKIL